MLPSIKAGLYCRATRVCETGSTGQTRRLPFVPPHHGHPDAGRRGRYPLYSSQPCWGAPEMSTTQIYTQVAIRRIAASACQVPTPGAADAPGAPLSPQPTTRAHQLRRTPLMRCWRLRGRRYDAGWGRRRAGQQADAGHSTMRTQRRSPGTGTAP